MPLLPMNSVEPTEIAPPLREWAPRDGGGLGPLVLERRSRAHAVVLPPRWLKAPVPLLPTYSVIPTERVPPVRLKLPVEAGLVPLPKSARYMLPATVWLPPLWLKVPVPKYPINSVPVTVSEAELLSV